VSGERAPLEHLLRGVEELCRAAGDAAALARERVARSAAEGEALSRALASLAETASEWLANAAATEELRAGLRAEALRWELRAGEDPAARRVHDLVTALLDLLEPAASAAPESGAPRRSARRGFRGRPREAR
jgi:hypothetical protein